MAVKIVAISLDDKVKKMADELTENQLDVHNRSHLISTLIIKEYRRIFKDKK